MQAISLVTVKPGVVGFHDVEVPNPGPGEVLVRGAFLGLCAGNTERFTGAAPTDYPVGIGHEKSGVVTAVGDGVRSVRVGDSVAAWTPMDDGGTHWLSRAEWCVTGDLSLKELALAEPLADCVNAVNRPLHGGWGQTVHEDVVILGTGFMAFGVLQAALEHHPTSVTVVGRRHDALDLARALGATHAVNWESENVRAAVDVATEGRGASVIYEAMGVQAGVTLREQLIDWQQRLYQTVVVVGYHQTRTDVDTPIGHRMVNEEHLNVSGTPVLQGHFRDRKVIMAGMRDAVAMMESGRLTPLDYIGSTFPFADSQAALEFAASRREWRKVMIDLTAGA
jgi:threonine dehydrogenase-like Zn-dependent dehydrogenase